MESSLRPFAGAALAAALALAAPGAARADTLVPAPGESGHDAALLAKADAHDRFIHAVFAVPLGWGLEADVSDPADRALLDTFAASGATDLFVFSGVHAYEAVDDYDEYGDLGMFGGVQAAGDAFRYGVLRDGGAPAADVDAARAELLRAMDGLHWYTAVTGTPGLVARGLRRVTSAPGEPPPPGVPPALTPLFDGAGNPLPPDKAPTWRADVSGTLPFLVWLDDTSKDQIDGYVFALGAVYDVVAGDPTIPATLVDRLAADAGAIGARLMERVEVAPGVTADLVLQDADGRVTSFHDLSAEEVTPGVVFANPTNGFNAWMALGVMRTLYQVSGDEAIGRFYYDELVGARRYLDVAEATLRFMYTGNDTNFSNVNMAFVAAYGLLRYEPEDAVGADARRVLEEQLYAPGLARDADELGQSFFDFVYAAFRDGGALGDADGLDARADALATLSEFPAAPWWNVDVQNCDAAEEAALSCIGIDGTPIALSPVPGRGGGLVAVDAVPMRIRPPDNFEWRQDPHAVNGGGGTRLNPAGDFHGAYWMGRWLAATDDGRLNVSLRARPAPPPLPASDGGAVTDGGADAGAGGSGGGRGCGCRVAGARADAPSGAAVAPFALAVLAALRVRRRHGGAPRRRGETRGARASAARY
ncbi:MAG TPA: hypothetical protein VG389_02900 [Myxococcota bacterium]|jgi:MYXO-CTERM domain-containing protein|nr:hypothetical protein [Myxococcota bacterium]